jgi:hypothetical protein
LPRGGDNPERGLLTDEVGIAQFAAGIQSQYGEFQNAEDMIRAHQSMADPALRRAQLTDVDEEATGDLDLEDAEAMFDLEEGEKLVDYRVRGNALVGVVESSNGRLDKVVTGANERYEPPALTPAEAAAKAQADHDVALAREAAKLRQEMELKIEEMRQDLQAENAEALAKLQEEKAAELESAQEEAAAEAEAAAPKPKSTAKAKS